MLVPCVVARAPGARAHEAGYHRIGSRPVSLASASAPSARASVTATASGSRTTRASYSGVEAGSQVPRRRRNPLI